VRGGNAALVQAADHQRGVEAEHVVRPGQGGHRGGWDGAGRSGHGDQEVAGGLSFGRAQRRDPPAEPDSRDLGREQPAQPGLEACPLRGRQPHRRRQLGDGGFHHSASA
jgi:hypothetical protein